MWKEIEKGAHSVRLVEKVTNPCHQHSPPPPFPSLSQASYSVMLLAQIDCNREAQIEKRNKKLLSQALAESFLRSTYAQGPRGRATIISTDIRTASCEQAV